MSEIKERPILFSASMVRAILEGRKTVTRRAVKPQPEVREVDMIGPMLTFKNKRGGHWLYPNAKAQIIADCPYGQPGKRLWVREACRYSASLDHYSPSAIGEKAVEAGYTKPWCPTRFEADGAHNDGWQGFETPPAVSVPGKLRPPMFMPRWASRILLEITDVRVERLQDITRPDIRAEGLQCPPELASDDVSPNYRDWYLAAWRELWESTGGNWEANPWVWVVEFKQVTP